MQQISQPYQQYMYSYPHKTAYGPLSHIHLKEYMDKLAGKENSLYFHIPFCQYKCGYCNLFSVAGQSEQWMTDYVDAMERQSAQLAQILPSGVSFTDVTLGGGTPLLLPVRLLERVFTLAADYFGFEPDGHTVVVETSPNQTTEEKLALLKQVGVTRISIGIQSFQETELAALRRFHTAASARKALQFIRQANFDCMNIDLIYGIAGQTLESLMDSLKQALEFEPEELFVYPLYVQPGTFLYQQRLGRQKEALKETLRIYQQETGSQSDLRMYQQESGSQSDLRIYQQELDRQKRALQMYRHVREFLLQAGYQPYSMRRFVKKDADTNGNLPESCCGFGNTLSVGCGGRSYIGNLHFCTPYAVRQEQCLSILSEYVNREDYLQVTHGFLLSLEEEKRRYVIRHILFGRGINRADYRMHFREDVVDAFPQILEWEQFGYVLIENAYISLTKEGFALSDYLGPQLISEAVKAKSQQYLRKAGYL